MNKLVSQLLSAGRFAGAFVVIGCILGCNGDGSNSSQSKEPVPGWMNKTSKIDVSSDETDAREWPNLYGPDYDSVSKERNLVTTWGDAGPPVLWSHETGSGYSAPIVSGGKVIVMFREWAPNSPEKEAENERESSNLDLPPEFMPTRPSNKIEGDFERVDCLDAESGDLLWSHRYATDFTCQFEYSAGPYATPVANKKYVVTVSAAGLFFCLDLESGDVVWQRQLLEDYGVELKEWPVTASPLIWQDLLIFNLGLHRTGCGDCGIGAGNRENGLDGNGS